MQVKATFNAEVFCGMSILVEDLVDGQEMVGEMTIAAMDDECFSAVFENADVRLFMGATGDSEFTVTECITPLRDCEVKELIALATLGVISDGEFGVACANQINRVIDRIKIKEG
jgi:hypothetical protein